jgi:hypothetical protein
MFHADEKSIERDSGIGAETQSRLQKTNGDDDTVDSERRGEPVI